MDKHLGRGVLGFLQKPFRMDDLARVVSNAFVTSEPDQRAD
jgi:FixJ family two-component response regulator